MKISTMLYTIKQGFANVFRNILFSLASVATISACLFLFSIFFIIVMNFQGMVKSAEEGVSVTVFFSEEGITDERKAEIGDLIKKRVEVSEVNYISEEEAWLNYQMKELGGIAEGIDENLLAGDDNYEVFLNDISMQSSLVTYLESLAGVRSVKRSDVVASALTGFNKLIGYVSAGIIGILLAVSIFLIRNTITIGISVRKEEINIMKYIGATDFFVRAPFVIEGMIIGLVGAAIPLGLTLSLYDYIQIYIMENFSMLEQFLNFLSSEEIFKFLTPISLCVGVGIGFFGSITTVRKHLRV